ncbi:MAG: HAMP domain-containing sensor histidine kinase, partial [Pseudomonadota bacterium]
NATQTASAPSAHIVPVSDVTACEVQGDVRPAASANSIIADLHGDLVDVGENAKRRIPQLAEAVCLTDLVHVADRVAWLRAWATCKTDAAIDLPPLSVRIDTSAKGKPQSYKSCTVAWEQTTADAVSLTILPAVASDTAHEPDTEEASATRFLAMMSHELRTPLNAILGFSDLLRNEDIAKALPDAQKGEYIHLIHGAAEHLLSVINTVLDVSKIGAGKYEVYPEPFDVTPVIAESLSMVSTQAATKSIRINNRATLALDEICGDRRAIKQVLINLLANAVKFTPERGCVTLDATIDGDTLRLSVADTGIGMDEDQLARIFQPFCQLDNGLNRSIEGTGLGLSLVKGLVDLHGGRIDVASAPTMGTEIVVTLPGCVVSPIAYEQPPNIEEDENYTSETDSAPIGADAEDTCFEGDGYALRRTA